MAHTTAAKEKQLYLWPGRATHLAILALRAAHWDEFLYIAAAVRGDAGKENVTSCGATSKRLQHRWQFWSWTVCPYSEITCKSCMVFMTHFDGVLAFGYNSTGIEAIWMKIGALWVYCLPLTMARDTLPSPVELHWTIRLRRRCALCQITFTTWYLWTPTWTVTQIAKCFELSTVGIPHNTAI